MVTLDNGSTKRCFWQAFTFLTVISLLTANAITLTKDTFGHNEIVDRRWVGMRDDIFSIPGASLLGLFLLILRHM
jgi:hypothetical protein